MTDDDPGRVPECSCQPGDLVEDLETGEVWTVDGYESATAYEPARVVLGRDTGDGAVVTDRTPDQVRLVTRATERSIYPGDGWSDHVMLRQTGKTVAEFTAELATRFDGAGPSQFATTEPEAELGG